MIHADVFVGIDPGFKGAVVAIDRQSRVLFQHTTPTFDLKKGSSRQDYAVSEMVRILRSGDLADVSPDRVVVVLEKVSSRPKEGSSSAFAFGRGYGLWEGIASALAYKLVTPAPNQWSKIMLRDCGGGDNASIVCAGRLLPQLKLILPRCRVPHDGLADAGCLALYGLSQHGQV